MPGGWLIRSDSILGMKPWIFLYSITALFCVVLLHVRNVCCGDNSRQEELANRIVALYKTVNFMAQRPHQMNVDAVFGLTMVEANVKQTLNHENVQFFDQPLLELLFEILELSQRARLRALTVVSRRNDKSATLNQILNQPDIWRHPIHWSSGSLGPRPQPSKNNTEEAVLTYFHKGTPNETESDWCIVRLAKESTERSCQVSDHCADMLLRNDNSRGYPLTHRLLYVQIAIALRCKENEFTPFEKLIPAYCTAIWQDAVDMEDAGFPAISRDMISEQVLLCGMEGYTEFVNDHYAGLIISWANSAGCYSAFGISRENVRQRSKRETEPMDFGCDNHATSLSAASLSLLIRHSVETSRRRQSGGW